VPAWVRDTGYGAIMRDIRAGLLPWPPTMTEMYAEHMRRVQAAEQWCAERGLSYCMTVLNWKHPSPGEVAAGLTKGPGDL
jgi:hypothetical protein